MYVTTGYLRVVALDAATGKELWQFDPLKDHPFAHRPASGGVNRGCAYWSDGKPDGERRIIHGTSDGRLFSLDAKTGKLDPKFGDGGHPQSPQGARSEGRRARATGRRRPRPSGRIRSSSGSPATKGPASPRPGISGRSTSAPARRSGGSGPCPVRASSGHETWDGDSWKDRGGANAWGGLSVDVDRGPGLRRARIGGLRLLRRRPARRQPVRQLHDRARRQDGQARLALPDAAPRPLGPRPAGLSQPGHGHPRRQADRRRRAGDEDGLCLPVRPRDGQAALRRQGAARAGLRHPRRTGVADAADPGQAAAVLRPVSRRDRTSPTSARPTARRSWPGCERSGAGRPSTRPAGREPSSSPASTAGRTGPGPRSIRRPACSTSTRTTSPNIITLVETKASDRSRHGPYRHHGLRPVPRPRGLLRRSSRRGAVLNAINLNTGEFAWRVPLGEHVELTARGIPRTGTETFGGSIVTAGGLVFIAGTKDERIHAFDKQTGQLLWEHPLPAGGYATPSTYQVERPPVRRHRRRRRRQAADEGGRCVRGVLSAGRTVSLLSLPVRTSASRRDRILMSR